MSCKSYTWAFMVDCVFWSFRPYDRISEDILIITFKTMMYSLRVIED